ncbi:hypothetical protein BOX15_Mlig012920g1 [Macrostomum lignano]|uniref:RRM domain-containing protein n=1 Tax=Macrostomum lignano TaxID=282301 RepID=A0A267GC60_9PLAT|nr:hypothetical protein BOX15_Mlig000205g1 [Macrostomum lignano]PAA83635.1 hypothetical protein BOX15_Mlig012920g1 [Macrostomum lignano]
MQVNPHMPGMMPMAPVSSMQQSMPMVQQQPMTHPGQMPMMAYGQQPPQQQQQPFMAYPQPGPPMPGVMPPPPPPQMQMQGPGPMDMQFMMQQQQQPPQMLHHQHGPQNHRQHHGGGGGGGGGGSGQNPKGRVFIGNLNTNELGRADLERIFSKYGSLTEVNVHNGFAFVQFVEEPAARSACKREDGRVYAGQTIDVNIASEPKNRRDRHGGGSGSSASSVVSGGGGGGSSGLSVKERLGPRRLGSQDDSGGFDSGKLSQVGASRDRISGGRDYLVCGNCKDVFDNLDRLSSHKQDGCRRRFVCLCKLKGEPRMLDCAKCGKQFLSSWELLRHCQAEHEIGVYTNCVFAAGIGGGETAASAAAASSVGGSANTSGEIAAATVEGSGGDGPVGAAAGAELSSAAASETEPEPAGGSRRRGEMEDDEATDEDEDDDDSDKND